MDCYLAGADVFGGAYRCSVGSTCLFLGERSISGDCGSGCDVGE